MTQPPGVGAGEGVADAHAPTNENGCVSAAVSVNTGPTRTPLASRANIVWPAERVLHGVAPHWLKLRLRNVMLDTVYVAPRSTIQNSPGPLPSEL